MKCWQGYCNVPLKSFWIELIAVEFLPSWQYSKNTTVYYDWMIRDFLAYLLSKVWGSVTVPGTLETIYLGNDWESRAKSAYERALKAVQYEQEESILAGYEWQKIFGTDIPI